MRRVCVLSYVPFGLVLAAVGVSFGAGKGAKDAAASASLPMDWSHSHVVFSRPTGQQAGRVEKDFRYQMQRQRQEKRAAAKLRVGKNPVPPRFRRRKFHPDWAFDLGPGASVGAGRYPAKYALETNVANCAAADFPDFVVYGTGLPGVSGPVGQGSIVALTNLYQGCAGQVPGVYWSYNTGFTVNTSPVLSRDGTQIAFTQTDGATSSLVILKWAKFTGIVQNPVDLIPVFHSDYRSCDAPCMTVFDLGADDTNSSVFYDYSSDRAWVGDDEGVLHQFTDIFLGTPAEVTTGGWPVTVNLGLGALTNSVHNNRTDQTFVGDSLGFLYRVDPLANITQSGQLDSGMGLTNGPVIDPSIEAAYVVASDDGVLSAAVYQLSTNFTDGETGTKVTIGAKSIGGNPIYGGSFDHNYLTSADATGNLYVCGEPGARPVLYQVQIVEGVMTGSLPGPTVSTTNPSPCGPVTVVYNPNVTGAGLPQEWAFLGTQGSGSPTGCGGFACVMNFKITSWQPNTVYNKGQEILDSNLNIQVCENSGGTSGATPPAWNTTNFAPTDDNGVHWRNQGKISAQTPPIWQASNGYPGAFKILDPNNNIEIAQLPGGISDVTIPTFGLNEGDTTTDGTVTWVNLGAYTVAAFQESGGTSGIIIDNILEGLGLSQIYFSTLEDQACPTSGGVGGCAIQASQVNLQ